MLNLKKKFLVLSSVFALIFSPAAYAGDPVIDAAKDRGEVGEQIDGYLGLVGSVSPAVRRKVDEINIKRREVYSGLATRQNQTPAVVARLTGEKLINGEDNGRFILDDSGRWKKK